MEAQKFRDFITEGEIKPYRFVLLWYDDPQDPEDPEKTADKIIEEGKKLGCTGFKVDIDGAYSDIDDNGQRYIYRLDDNKGFLIDENTLVFVRAPVTKRKAWMDLLTQFERENICCVNSRHCMEITTDKYRTSLILAEQQLNQPKNVLIHHQDKSLDVFDRLGAKFPIIIKTLTGSLGIGVIKVESEESLSATTQILHQLDENKGLLLQEFILTTYDVRVQVVAGKIHGAIKRPIPKKDFRSNVAQGSNPVAFKLTALEEEQVILATKAVDGLWVGVDFIPAKNRETDLPFFIEINSTPGTKGYVKATQTNLCKDVVKTFLDRANWLRQKPTESIYGLQN